MGICSSCLGGRGRRDSYDNDEESPLFEDGNLQYGSFSEQNTTNQDDLMEARLETEALQRVVAKTSDNMVDIFEIAPQSHSPHRSPSPFSHAAQEARLQRYRNLLSKLAAAGEGEGEGADGVQVDWIPREGEDDGTLELQNGMRQQQEERPRSAKSEGDDPLVGTFADAAAAMR